MITSATDQAPAGTEPPSETGEALQLDRPRLGVDTDTEVCVVGAGLAGLTVARELARNGTSVVVLEGRHVGWNASGHNLGAVMPGYAVAVEELIARVGVEDTSELWALSQQGADYVRATAVEACPQTVRAGGALDVSTVDAGDRLIGRLQTLSENFGADVEGWQVERVRDTLKTDRYFHALHFPGAFQLDPRCYLDGLARLAEQAGVRIFEDTPVVSIDHGGIRKRIVTPSARLRASHVVLAGNLHIGAPALRLAGTLLPVWRYAALTAPLGDRLDEVIGFRGSVSDDNGIDHFRIVGDNRLMWSSPETTWQANPEKFGKAIRRRIRTVFPQLADVGIENVWSAAFGRTVHGMPQIGQLRPGLWVASGFGRQGLNTTAAAGELIAKAILERDDRWRLFSPFELVWTGGTAGRAVGHAANVLSRQTAALAGTFSRLRERAAVRERDREMARARRLAAIKVRSAEMMRRSSALQRSSRQDSL
ncbi:MAG: FAD-binding oxidoreductase [Afipia sp.]|nr:FAD-binding oxidoreductase [Afipia sp.]OJW64327.1 MAG: FAD-dependent oxidoreductase [Afipia sp. 64-13]